METFEEYLTRERAAEIARNNGLEHFSVDVLRMLDYRRKGPPITKIGGRVYYRKRAFMEWLLSHEQKQVRAGK